MERLDDLRMRRHRDAHFVRSIQANHVGWMLSITAFQVAVITVLVLGGLPLWRVQACAASAVLLSIYITFTIRKVRPSDHLGHKYVVVALAVLAQISLWIILTGGMQSPMTPSLLISAIIPYLFFGPHPAAWRLTMVHVVVAIAIALLPHSVTGPTLPPAHHTIASVIILTWGMFDLFQTMARFGIASTSALCSMAEAREDRLTSTQEQHRRLQAVGAKVAHELKNPLAAIKGLVQLINRTPSSERTGERLRVVESEVGRMEATLREYLTFARPLEELRPEAIDLADVVKAAAEMTAGRIDGAGLTLTVDTVPTLVQGDRRRLIDALVNLLSNAVEASRPGGEIKLSTRTTRDGGRIELRDHGAGIAADDLTQLGRAFFTTRDDGTGLGLVLAVGAIGQHGGLLHIASHKGHGTLARIDLPHAPTTERPFEQALTTGVLSAARC